MWYAILNLKSNKMFVGNILDVDDGNIIQGTFDNWDNAKEFCDFENNM